MRRTISLVALLGFAACADPGSKAGPRPSGRLPPPIDGTPEALSSLVPAPVYTACGTPTIDGVILPGEWDGAVTVRFAAVLPESFGGGVVPAEIQALSDDRNLYLSYRLGARTDRFAQSHVVELDADWSGTLSQGDDAFGFSWWPDVTPEGYALFFDDYRWNCLIDGEATVCAPYDDDPSPDFAGPGTVDGGAAIRFGDDSTVVEVWHPYAGGDPRDVALAPGDSIPLTFSIRLLDTCPDWPRCFGDTYFPPDMGYRPFILGCGGQEPEEEVVEVRIDVKPGDPVPTIHLGSGGSTAVAVLGSERFDASSIDAASVHFAGAPIGRRDDGTPQATLGDVNGDARPDLVCHFPTASLHLDVGATEATLAGKTTDGQRFHGTDVVQVLP